LFILLLFDRSKRRHLQEAAMSAEVKIAARELGGSG